MLLTHQDVSAIISIVSKNRILQVWFNGRTSAFQAENVSSILITCSLCASGSVVEYRLAKARVAGSNPVSRFFYYKNAYSDFTVSVFLYVMDKPTWICYSRGKKNPLNGEGEKEEQHGAY